MSVGAAKSQSCLQVKVMREASPSQATTDIRINGDSADASAERPSPSPSSAAGAASYGASTMGITIQPSQRLPPGGHSDDDSMGESSPSGSPSAGREGVTSLPVQLSTNAFAAAAAAAAAVAALPVQQTAVSPRRVSILRGGPVAGSYIDGRWVHLPLVPKQPVHCMKHSVANLRCRCRYGLQHAGYSMDRHAAVGHTLL